jgi:hypothetical protein
MSCNVQGKHLELENLKVYAYFRQFWIRHMMLLPKLTGAEHAPEFEKQPGT